MGRLFECADCDLKTMNESTAAHHHHNTLRRTWYAGLVQMRRARETKTYVGIYRSDDAGLDDGGGTTPYTTVCEEHGLNVAHETLAMARHHASNPTGWCSDCQDREDV
jgi:hypothetical protein